MENECPCCFLNYDVIQNNIKKVQLHDWIEVLNESAKHWLCNQCHAKIMGEKNKCPHCRESLIQDKKKVQYVSTAIQPYVQQSPLLHLHLNLGI